MSAAPEPERSRAQLLHDLDRLNRHLARWRMPPLIDRDTAEALDDRDLRSVVRASGHRVADLAATLGRYG